MTKTVNPEIVGQAMAFLHEFVLKQVSDSETKACELARRLRANAEIDSIDGVDPDVIQLELDAAAELFAMHVANSHLKTMATQPTHHAQDGWKLMPVELTREMLDAAKSDLVRDGEIDPMLKRIYSALIDAAPQPIVQPVRKTLTRQRIVELAQAAGCETHDRKGEIRIGSAVMIGCDSTDAVVTLVQLAIAEALEQPVREPLKPQMLAEAKKECGSNFEKIGIFVSGWVGAENAHGIVGADSFRVAEESPPISPEPAPIAPYAEAKAAFADGVLDFEGIHWNGNGQLENIWVTWSEKTPPKWLQIAPERFRRRPKSGEKGGAA